MADADKERRFQEAVLYSYKLAKKECGYNAPRFLKMIGEQGAYQAARSLLVSTGYSEGFTHLWESRRLDLSVEALVLRSQWRDMFSSKELATARQRLEEYKYNFDE